MSGRFLKSAALLAAIVIVGGRARADDDTPAEFAAAKSEAKDIVETLRASGEALDRRPGKVDPSRWGSIAEGAKELKAKVAHLREQIATEEQLGDSLGAKGGKLQVRLGATCARFESLAGQAESQARGLPEPLRTVVLRERENWRRWAQISETFGSTFASVLAGQEKRIGQLAEIDLILKRLSEGADGVLELAALGQQVDGTAMQANVDELNAILDAFDHLSDGVKAAIAQAEPTKATAPEKAATGKPSPRRWTSRTGGSFSGTLVGLRADSVLLQAEWSGRTFQVPLNELSPGDQALVRRAASASTLAAN